MYSDGLRYYSKNDEARQKNAVADGIANGAITLIWESKFDHVVLFIRRLQIMIKDVNEQLQSSVKTSDSFFLEIYPMQLSMARIGWEEILLSLSLSLSSHDMLGDERHRKLPICLCYLSKISKPNMCFSWKCLQTWVCFAKKVSDPARRIRNHRNCSVGG